MLFSARMRSTTRPSRFAVDSDSVPDALMSSAGVIIALRICPAPRKSIAVMSGSFRAYYYEGTAFLRHHETSHASAFDRRRSDVARRGLRAEGRGREVRR